MISSKYSEAWSGMQNRIGRWGSQNQSMSHARMMKSPGRAQTKRQTQACTW